MNIQVKKNKFLFIGNRFNVLKRMLELELAVGCIYAAKGSYLEGELEARSIKYKKITSFNELINNISSEDFDILISNGCPYVLPVSQIKKDHQLFINIHPSLLPDLKGLNSINGAILFNRDAGVTCHIMDDGIDTGDVISQINLGRHQNLAFLYQLSFMAEAQVFTNALNRNFRRSRYSRKVENPIYYTRKEKDMKIDLKTDITSIVQRVKAFGIKSQGAYLIHNNRKITVLDATILKDKFLIGQFNNAPVGMILLKYEDSIVVKVMDGILLLSPITTGYDTIHVGDSLI